MAHLLARVSNEKVKKKDPATRLFVIKFVRVVHILCHGTHCFGLCFVLMLQQLSYPLVYTHCNK